MVYPTQVHTQIHLSLDTAIIDYSHKLLGSALARFELSTLPEHKGTRTILLRFLKIMTPVECVLPHYDDYICWPKEGELYRKKIIINRVPEWSFNIDKPCHTRGSSNRRSLKLLLNT